MTHGIQHYTSWSRYGLQLHSQYETDDYFSIFNSKIDTYSESQSQPLLFMIIHFQSRDPIQFNSLRKDSIHPSSVIDAMIHKVLCRLL